MASFQIFSSKQNFNGTETLPGQSRRGFKWLPILLFIGYGVYYYYSSLDTVPITGRSHLVGMSVDEEMALGVNSYRTIVQEEEIIPDGKAADSIKSAGKRIAAVTENATFDWEFNLIKSNEMNAFCLPGGKVAIYSGILPVADNENGLAVIMSHEISHAIARHGAERMAHERLFQFGQIALSMSTSEMDNDKRRMVMGAFGLGAQYGLILPYSREHESEADYMGLIFMSKACFDPTEAPKVWERMVKMNDGKKPPEFMSTHPSDETRIEQFQKWMPEALDIYKNCKKS